MTFNVVFDLTLDTLDNPELYLSHMICDLDGLSEV